MWSLLDFSLFASCDAGTYAVSPSLQPNILSNRLPTLSGGSIEKRLAAGGGRSFVSEKSCFTDVGPPHSLKSCSSMKSSIF